MIWKGLIRISLCWRHPRAELIVLEIEYSCRPGKEATLLEVLLLQAFVYLVYRQRFKPSTIQRLVGVAHNEFPDHLDND